MGRRTVSFLLCMLLAGTAGPVMPVLADEFDSITDVPPPAQNPDIPFFGDPVVVPESRQEPRVVKPRAEKPRVEKPRVEKPRAEKQKPVPAPRAEAKPPRRSDRLEIPADAARKKDLSFLEGCWYFEKGPLRADRPGAPFLGTVQDRFCFNKHGQGRFVQRYVDTGQEYSTRATARFSGGQLVLHYPNFRNKHGMRASSTYTCNGQDAGTMCHTYAPGTRYLSHHGSVRISRRP